MMADSGINRSGEW